MLQLLQPAWLWGMMGILIPLAIHFWNYKPGRILKIGSVALLTASQKQYKRQIKLADLLILLLRSLLIAVLSLAFARPLWQQLINTRTQKGWVLMEKKNIRETYAHFKHVTDSLLSAGFEFHNFHTGFKKENLSVVLDRGNDTANDEQSSYWKLIASLNDQLPSNFPIYLFTNNYLKNFSGSRPQVSLNLNWQTYQATDSLSESIAEAYTTFPDSIRIAVLHNRPTGSNYSFIGLSPQMQSDGFQVSSAENNLRVSMNKGLPVIVDTSTLWITIFTDKYEYDARYLKSAVDAIQQFSKRKIKCKLVNNIDEIPGKQDWLFWMSEQVVQPTKQTGHLFIYEKGKVQTTPSWVTKKNIPLTSAPVFIYKRIQQNTTNLRPFKTLWQDGFGNAVLSIENNERPVYHFFTHFDPTWNDLPWSSSFPSLVYQLINSKESFRQQTDSSDKRNIDPVQMQPAFIMRLETTGAGQWMTTTELTDFLWPAVFILFLLERLFSFQNKKWKGNG